MKKLMEQRLQRLKDEFATGQHVLADLEARQAGVRNVLARIGGAIQVLEELLEHEDPAAAG